MTTVTRPQDMTPAFAEAFNSRDLERLLALYEDDAVLCADTSGAEHRGRDAIARALAPLLQLPGTMESRNNFCIVHGALALLRADYVVRNAGGACIAQGGTAELVRRQPAGHWLYVVDHATAMSLPSVLGPSPHSAA
ncbi:MAG: nuclear transport factor 2 family protein [Pseudomonadota bacterium]